MAQEVSYISHSGNDLLVVNAARVSFYKHRKEFGEDDKRLLSYLARNNHWTPFAHPQITLRMKTSIPVRTQCFKHKQGFVENEVSRRYIDTTPTIFHPIWRRRNPNAKQGSLNEFPSNIDRCDDIYSMSTTFALRAYEMLLEEGIAPEQARMVLPQGMETEWYWTGSLAAFSRFYKERTNPTAQYEIQELAKEVSKIIHPLFPEAWGALTEAVNVS